LTDASLSGLETDGFISKTAQNHKEVFIVKQLRQFKSKLTEICCCFILLPLQEQNQVVTDLRNEVSRLENVCAEKNQEVERIKQELQSQQQSREV
jgi:hypothetical protein